MEITLEQISEEIPCPEEYLDEHVEFHRPAVQAEVRRILAEMRRFPIFEYRKGYPVIILEGCLPPPDHLARGVTAAFRVKRWDLTFYSGEGKTWATLTVVT